jgi:L-rhamnose mutarotase
MNRSVLTLDVRDDPEAIAAYRRHHAEAWPEVVRSLKAAGVVEMDIYLLGTRLVMIVELQDGLDLQHVFDAHRTSNPRVAEWEQLMLTLQQRAPGAPADQWWAVMEPVFQLSRQQPSVDTPEPVSSR